MDGRCPGNQFSFVKLNSDSTLFRNFHGHILFQLTFLPLIAKKQFKFFFRELKLFTTTTKLIKNRVFISETPRTPAEPHSG